MRLLKALGQKQLISPADASALSEAYLRTEELFMY